MQGTFIQIENHFLKIKNIESFTINFDNPHIEQLMANIKDIGQVEVTFLTCKDKSIAVLCFSDLINWILSQKDFNLISSADISIKLENFKKIYIQKGE